MRNKIKKILNKFRPYSKRIIEIIKNNKILSVVILIAVFSFYFFGIRPSQIRKECSTVIKNNFFEGTNPEYNEPTEKQKEEQLGEYINCRNNNLITGDQKVSWLGNPYYFTQTQYNTLPLEDSYVIGDFRLHEGLNHLVLDKMPEHMFVVYFYNYIGYYIANPTYEDLKTNKDKYPMCTFPDNFISKETYSGSEYTTNASDEEYKDCLRNHGLNY